MVIMVFSNVAICCDRPSHYKIIFTSIFNLFIIFMVFLKEDPSIYTICRPQEIRIFLCSQGTDRTLVRLKAGRAVPLYLWTPRPSCPALWSRFPLPDQSSSIPVSLQEGPETSPVACTLPSLFFGSTPVNIHLGVLVL